MLQLMNFTPFAGTLTMFPDAEGVDTVYAIIKATFQVRAGTRGFEVDLAENQIPVSISPEYHGEPGASSLKRALDISLEKPGVDIVLFANAWAPHGRMAHVMDVGVRVGSMEKVARIFGDRFWKYTGVGFQTTAPEPFLTMPIVWERAYGGADRMEQDTVRDPRNPVGTGFRNSEGGLPVEGMRLPNIEDPSELIASWSQRPKPVGFAPIDAYWEPRRSYAGTYDEQWQKHRAPYLPEDFDARFSQIAPPDMIVPRVESGDWVDLRGLTPDGVLQFQIPNLRLHAVYSVDGSTAERPAVLDTVIIEPDERRFQLVWRATMRCDKKVLKVRHVELHMTSTA